MATVPKGVFIKPKGYTAPSSGMLPGSSNTINPLTQQNPALFEQWKASSPDLYNSLLTKKNPRYQTAWDAWTQPDWDAWNQARAGTTQTATNPVADPKLLSSIINPGIIPATNPLTGTPTGYSAGNTPNSMTIKPPFQPDPGATGGPIDPIIELPNLLANYTPISNTPIVPIANTSPLPRSDLEKLAPTDENTFGPGQSTEEWLTGETVPGIEKQLTEEFGPPMGTTNTDVPSDGIDPLTGLPIGTTTDTTTDTNILDFPEGIYNSSRSGLSPEQLEMLTSIINSFQDPTSGFAAKQTGLYDTARTGLTEGYGEARGNLSGLFKNALQPALQQTLNSLAGRNMINSSVSGEALAQTATGLGEKVQAQLAALSLEEQKALANLTAQQAGTSNQEMALLTNLLGLGQVSETKNEWDPYRDKMNFLGQLSQ